VWDNWEKGECEEMRLVGHLASVYALQLDGDTLVSGSADGCIKGSPAFFM